jgi:hypothetical protein
MRQTSFLAGVVVLTIVISTANAQGRYFSAGSNDHAGVASRNRSDQRGGGAINAGSNGGGGVVINAAPASGASTTPNNPTRQTPASTPQAPRSTNFNRPIIISNSRDRDGDRDRNFRHRPYVVSAPGYVYYSDDYPPSDSSQQQQQATEQSVQPEAPAPTIFENRPGYQAPPVQFHPTSQMAANQSTEGVERTSAAEPQPTTILVFRDGHMIEIGNYAIVDDTLYNLAGDYRTHKILLADLDLNKTVKINQERGYEFRLPKQQGN